ncbi:flagellar type III secretion system protein FlhB [Parvibium lacunae]|uniref:Flagellar biosynthetic protein FlhB n=2 Tax=Parvibium lacunae TaxID=1888893 RepID=A0A368L3P6_9BURK|nr:flagellar type III secretion system protein FlhB [Parvibium lacunae]
MAEESDQEKSLPASQRRIDQAREEGNVLRSRELVTALVTLSGLAVCWFGASWLYSGGREIMLVGLRFNHANSHDPAGMLTHMQDLGLLGLKLVLPFIVATSVLALLGSIMLGGWNYSTKALMPDFTKLDPISGLGKIFSWQGLGELVKAVLKSLLIGGMGVWLVWLQRDAFVGMLMDSTEQALSHLMGLALKDFFILCGMLVLIAALDVPFQAWRYFSQLRMTMEEYKREAKETEGDPHVKSRIKQQQRDMARKRMMSEVPKADVIVTNPTHYAVAIKYQESGQRAPLVVAKGTDHVAQRIREIAQESNIPLLEAPPLARALYAHTELGQEIPLSLYTAVAQVLAYVYQLRAHRAAGLPTDRHHLPLPADLPVPKELDPAATGAVA